MSCGIPRNDVRAILYDNFLYHVDCFPKEKWSDLEEEDFLLKESWNDETPFEFCLECGKII